MLIILTTIYLLTYVTYSIYSSAHTNDYLELPGALELSAIWRYLEVPGAIWSYQQLFKTSGPRAQALVRVDFVKTSCEKDWLKM